MIIIDDNNNILVHNVEISVYADKDLEIDNDEILEINNYQKIYYTPKEIFNYEEHLRFMESKKVRHAEKRTGTLLDYITKKEEDWILKNKNYDLTSFDPTPEKLKNHFDFISDIYNLLLNIYPKDEFLISLEDNIKLKYSYDWYKMYGVDYEY